MWWRGGVRCCGVVVFLVVMWCRFGGVRWCGAVLVGVELCVVVVRSRCAGANCFDAGAVVWW